MKKLAYIAGMALIGAGALASCTLDAINYVEKTPENFPVTADDAVQGLAGIYENLNQVNATPQQSFYYLSMLASDDNLGGGGTNDRLMQAMDLLLNYQNDMTRQFWVDRYQGINRANSLLSGISNIQLEEQERNQIEGEAKFLRAFYYYELCLHSLRQPSAGDKSCKTCAMRPKICRLYAVKMVALINIRQKPCWHVRGYSIPACTATVMTWRL